MQKKTVTVRSGLVGMTALAFVAMPAAAQADDTTSARSGTLQEVVVTAQRREPFFQDSALAIEVLDEDKLSHLSVTRAADLTRAVPGLQIGLPLCSPGTYLMRKS